MIDEDGHLQMFVIYKDPIDIPQPCYFVRRWIVHPGHDGAVPDPFGIAAQSLENARLAIRDSVGELWRMDPSPGDDANIVEVWL